MQLLLMLSQEEAAAVAMASADGAVEDERGQRSRRKRAGGITQAMAAALLVLVLAMAMVGGAEEDAARRFLEGDAEEEEAVRRFLEAVHPGHSNVMAGTGGVCEWKGVKCDREGRRVEALLLEGEGLRGAIPSATIGKLTSLTRLSLYNNTLTSPIPQDLFDLPKLRYLSLSRNLFRQPFPPLLASNATLQRLDLSHNSFSGPLPSYLLLLPSVHFLFLSSNVFTGPFPPPPPPNRLPSSSLAVVDASQNRFSSLTNLLPASLVSLNLSHNAISGPVPASFSDLKTLSLLDLSHNAIAGSLPRLPYSRFLNLSNNLLSGSLSADLFGSHISDLDLSSNVLSADIPLFINSAPASLVRLDLSANNFSGNISMADLSVLVALDYLDLSFNRIEGALPPTLSRAANLSHIDLSNNQLQGTIPASLALLSNLTYLDLSNNSLVGDLAELAGASSLLYFNVSYNPKLGCNAQLLHKFGDKSFVGVMDCEPFAAPVGMPPYMIYHKYPNPDRFRKRWRDHRSYLIAGIVLGCVITLAMTLLVAAMVLWRKRQSSPVGALSLKRNAMYRDESRYMSGPFSFESNSGPWVANVKNAASVPVVMFEKPLLNLTFADLLRVTSNFNRETQVSQGGLGPVYSAVLPPGDLHVSVKVLIEGRILTNEAAAAQFTALAKVKHPNLVPLLGYCIVGEERLVIYEFMKNGGLHRWLLGTPETETGSAAASMYYDVSMDLAMRARLEPLPETANLSWPVRHKIALGLARGLAFLHHGQSTKIVHRDVKASNVMLDEEFEPHLANTGLAGLLAGTDDSAFARGSPGYVPPEYGQPGGEVTTMGDVFSYGVVLLELVTGKKPVGDSYEDLGGEYGRDCCGMVGCTNDLVSWVRILMQEKRGLLVQALDPRICEDVVSQEQMLDVLKIGYLCTAESPMKRPTIQQVVGLLKDMAPNLCSP